jgi:hypothetical protein
VHTRIDPFWGFFSDDLRQSELRRRRAPEKFGGI